LVRVISINAATGIGRLVLGVQCVAAGSAEEVQGFDRFEGGLYKQVAATVAGDQAL
jgi:hypothetical protein